MIKSKMVEGDVCILSKGHGITAYNLVFGVEMEGAPVQGEFGSLGGGIGFGLGVAMCRPDRMVYVVVGDGEMQEGSCLEAIAAMNRLGIWNVEICIDHNKMQGMGDCRPPQLGDYEPMQYGTHKGDSWECHYRNA
jgi:transketolase N-terminal domain/subunit